MIFKNYFTDCCTFVAVFNVKTRKNTIQYVYLEKVKIRKYEQKMIFCDICKCMNFNNFSNLQQTRNLLILNLLGNQCYIRLTIGTGKNTIYS